MSFEQALAFVVERRAIANPNENFRRQLQEYGRHLHRSAPKETNARARRGLVGPQRPPAEEITTREDCGAAIGPQLPRHQLMQAQEGDKAGIDASCDKEEVVNGPNLPPQLKREREQMNELHGGDVTSTKKTKLPAATEL